MSEEELETLINPLIWWFTVNYKFKNFSPGSLHSHPPHCHRIQTRDYRPQNCYSAGTWEL